jgi:hypothetical protein
MSNRSVFILLSILSVSSSVACELGPDHGPKPLALNYTKRVFTLIRENAAPVTIQRAFMDKELRGISQEKLDKLAQCGGSLQLHKMENCDDYTLRLKGGLKGGGILGAHLGFMIGKMAFSVVGHGTIIAVSSTVGLFCPPAGVATQLALQSALSVPIEAASVTVGLACGILTGAGSGPV